MNQTRPVTLKSLISYGVGDVYGGGSFIIISLLFIYFLTDIVGLPPYLAGLVVLIGKGWDAISDPLMGFISDHTHTRFGRRRFYFLIGIVPIALSFFLLWVNVNAPTQLGTFLYYMFAYIFFSTSFTMVMVPYSALNAEMTFDYKVRTRLSGARLIFSQFSSLLAGTIPKMITDRIYHHDQATGFLVMGAVFGIFYALPWLIVFFGTWEITVDRARDERSVMDFFRNLKTLFINKSFRIHIGMYICSYTALDLLMAVFVYYLTYYIGRSDIFSLCLGAMLLTQVTMLPVYVVIANKKGKGFAYILGLSIWGTAMALSLFITGSTPTYLIVLLSVLIGSGLSAGTMIPWAILPSVTDVDEMITTKERAGSYAGAMTLVRKLAQAVTLFIFGILLNLIGYQQPLDGVEQVQSPETLFWLKMIFFVAPFILILLGIMVARKFKITPETHPVLMDEIKRLKEGGSRDDVNPKTREVCETLTGHPYGSLYRKR